MYIVPCRAGELELDKGVPPLWAFRQRGDAPSTAPVDDVEDKDDLDEKEENMLLCKQCDAGIAKSADRISRSGKHLHTFFNPAGVVYEIGCFSRASGCRVEGPMSREFAWFADYSWQISFCSTCARHLGWFFSSGEDTFFGLIVNRLK
jgi:hypothetical protein